MQFAERKNPFGVGGGIVNGGHAISQVDIVRPVFLGCESRIEMPWVRVRINHSWHDGFARTIDDFGVLGNAHRARIAYCFNGIALYKDGAIGDDLLSLHRDDAGVGKSNEATRLVHRHIQADVDAFFGKFKAGIRFVGNELKAVFERNRKVLIAQGIVQNFAVCAPMQVDARVFSYLFDREVGSPTAQIEGRTRVGKSSDIHFLQVHKSHPFFIRRYRELAAISAAQMDAFIRAVQFATAHAHVHAAAQGVINAVSHGIEPGIVALPRDKSSGAAAGFQEVNAGFGGIGRAHRRAGTVFFEHNQLTIGGIGGRAVIRRIGGYRTGCGIVELDAPQSARSRIVVGHVQQRFSIG